MWANTESSQKSLDVLDVSYKTIECDVLIVGAGGAGMRAAIEVFDKGGKVMLVCKSLLGKAHTVMA